VPKSASGCLVDEIFRSFNRIVSTVRRPFLWRILDTRGKNLESTCYRNRYNGRHMYVQLRQTPGTGIWPDGDGDT
jgi:hypothetical protein